MKRPINLNRSNETMATKAKLERAAKAGSDLQGNYTKLSIPAKAGSTVSPCHDLDTHHSTQIDHERNTNSHNSRLHFSVPQPQLSLLPSRMLRLKAERCQRLKQRRRRQRTKEKRSTTTKVTRMKILLTTKLKSMFRPIRVVPNR
jgi:hypothetical protein